MVERKDKIKVESSIEIKRLKLVIVGEGGTGKSSILKKYCYNSFESRYNATIGADFMTRSVEYMGKEVKLNMWDMGGHAEYYEVRNEFYKESDALIMVYDIASKKSFDALDNWIREASKCGGELLPVWVVGNKTDQAHKRLVDANDAREWTKARKFVGFYETSALEGTNIHDLFQSVIEKLAS